MPYSSSHSALIIFDGVCNFCNSSVNFIIRHDKKNYFYFIPMQSEKAKEILEKYKILNSSIETFVVIENEKSYIKSTASLKIMKHLNGLYPLIYILFIVPKFIRDLVYDFIARNRYRWFGKRESCMIPSEKTKEKFIS